MTVQWTYEPEHGIVTVENIEWDSYFGTDGLVTTDSAHLEVTEPISPEFANGNFEKDDSADTGCEILDKMLEDWASLQ